MSPPLGYGVELAQGRSDSETMGGMTTRCPRCETTVNIDVTTVGEANCNYICSNGHPWQDVEFRRVRPYAPPLLYTEPRDEPAMVATFDLDPAPAFRQTPPRKIYCGPAADLPRVPSPGEILEGAGLGYLAA